MLINHDCSIAHLPLGVKVLLQTNMGRDELSWIHDVVRI